jgi:hypothetical protein
MFIYGGLDGEVAYCLPTTTVSKGR